jgi:hypothetical protein
MCPCHHPPHKAPNGHVGPWPRRGVIVWLHEWEAWLQGGRIFGEFTGGDEGIWVMRWMVVIFYGDTECIEMGAEGVKNV